MGSDEALSDLQKYTYIPTSVPPSLLLCIMCYIKADKEKRISK